MLANASFANLCVRAIDVSRTGLRVIEEGAFRGLEACLRRLYLGWNQLENMPRHALNHLAKLRRLSLSENPVQSFPASSLSGLSALVHLELDYLSLNAVPALAFAHLAALKVLSLRGNNLDKLPDNAFHNLKDSLEQLYLDKNQIIFVPGNALNSLKKLKRLSLTANQIQLLQGKDVSGLVSLEELFLDSNFLSVVPNAALRGLPALKSVSFSYNEFVKIRNGDFRGITNVQTLSLDGSNIEVIEPGSFAAMTNLTSLNLGHNLLTSDIFEGDGLQGLTSLQQLDLYGNKINQVPEDAFIGLENLLTLDMSDNNLGIILPKLFQPTQQLKDLYLQDASLSTMCPGALEDLQNLSRLYLHGNILINNLHPNETMFGELLVPIVNTKANCICSSMAAQTSKRARMLKCGQQSQCQCRVLNAEGKVKKVLVLTFSAPECKGSRSKIGLNITSQDWEKLTVLCDLVLNRSRRKHHPQEIVLTTPVPPEKNVPMSDQAGELSLTTTKRSSPTTPSMRSSQPSTHASTLVPTTTTPELGPQVEPTTPLVSERETKWWEPFTERGEVTTVLSNPRSYVTTVDTSPGGSTAVTPHGYTSGITRGVTGGTKVHINIGEKKKLDPLRPKLVKIAMVTRGSSKIVYAKCKLPYTMARYLTDNKILTEDDEARGYLYTLKNHCNMTGVGRKAPWIMCILKLEWEGGEFEQDCPATNDPSSELYMHFIWAIVLSIVVGLVIVSLLCGIMCWHNAKKAKPKKSMRVAYVPGSEGHDSSFEWDHSSVTWDLVGTPDDAPNNNKHSGSREHSTRAIAIEARDHSNPRPVILDARDPSAPRPIFLDARNPEAHPMLAQTTDDFHIIKVDFPNNTSNYNGSASVAGSSEFSQPIKKPSRNQWLV